MLEGMALLLLFLDVKEFEEEAEVEEPI